MVGPMVVMRRWYASRGFTMAVAVLFASAHAGNLAAVFAALALRSGADAVEAAVLLALLGFFGAYSVVVMTHGVALFPAVVAGRTVTTLNTALMGGAALAQWGAGRIVGLFPADTHDGAADAYTALFAALAHAEDGGERLSEREMLNMLRLLLIAGNETATNLIGNGMLALLSNPDQLARLRDDPGLIPAAVDELLRFDSPVQATIRRVRADCAVNGFELRARDNVVVLIGAANRDPEAFEEPDRLDVGRAHNPTSRSGAASTTASARRWRAWRDGSRSRRCWSASRGSSW